MKNDRRNFIKKIVVGSAALYAAPLFATSANGIRLRSQDELNDSELIRIALIGKGSQGTGDTQAALSVPGTKLVAVCDLYDARLKEAQKRWGDQLFITKDYQEILSRNDVDVVIIGTPDHWHQRISIDALKAGKHVYCEKPVIHKIKEADELIRVYEKSDRKFQSGSQGMASLGNLKAKYLIEAGILGKLNFAEGLFSAAPGDLKPFVAPAEASEKSIWWDQFIGNAPKVPYDPQRFFQWRNWKDYGTGIAGDLFVHVLSSLHFITGALGPEKVYTTGQINYHKDGQRNTPDIMLGYFNYPDRNGIGSYTVSLGANYVDGTSKKWGSMDFNIIGSKGAMQVMWDSVRLKTNAPCSISELAGVQKAGCGIDRVQQINPNEFLFETNNENKGAHHYHFKKLFDGIRNQTPIDADLMFGLRSAAPALLCYESYESGEPIYWDPVRLKKIKRPKK